MSWRAFREFDRKGFLIKEVHGPLAYTHGGYVFDRRFFWAFLVLTIALLGVVGYATGTVKASLYVHCPEQGEANALLYFGKGCANPYYRNCDAAYCATIADIETFPPGYTYGTPPPALLLWWLGNVWWVLLALFAVAAVANHYTHNRGRSLETIIPGVRL